MAVYNAEQTHSDVVGIHVVWTRNIWICFPDFNPSCVNWKHKFKLSLTHNKMSSVSWDHTFFSKLMSIDRLWAIKAKSCSLPLHCLLSICVILSTGSWRDRKWQVAVRLTGEDILVSVFTLVFWLLAFFPGIQQFALLLLKYLVVGDKGKKENEKKNLTFL